MTAAFYEAGHIKRQRATRAEIDERYSAIVEIVEENQPTGIRFTYYTATARGIVPKTQAGYVMVQRAILDMRRKGILPWPWIVDTARWMRKPTTWNSLQEALEATATTYRRALWSQADTAVEVWCESESVAGVLYPVTEKWDVPLYPCKGQSSETFAYGAAQFYKRDHRQLLILYVGDHDPHGYEIETNLHKKLVEFSGRTDIEFVRLACDAEEVTLLGLTGTPPKKDSYIDALTGMKVAWKGPAVEVEAIPPPVLRSWLDADIEAQVEPTRLRVIKVAEESEREALVALARRAS
jgi:hypothetical protein